MDCIPLPIICFQCGTDQNPCHCKVVGPTLGFATTVVMAVFCWPASIFCGCCATETGKKLLGAPADTGNAVSNSIPI
ncbi:hypothetical protein NA57DRAFT_44124 [Rhizodiscina lignyota]|uniref:Uncharacterized protein n=1 Tax=Rhizodiscina lignyota TaxID=1504668 RepID=A0A9P4IB12_9PEZI|nr:hypothetical protein NA57DRAFT_44124 [Rhizodiscina lignyota]